MLKASSSLYSLIPYLTLLPVLYVRVLEVSANHEQLFGSTTTMVPDISSHETSSQSSVTTGETTATTRETTATTRKTTATTTSLITGQTIVIIYFKNIYNNVLQS